MKMKKTLLVMALLAVCAGSVAAAGEDARTPVTFDAERYLGKRWYGIYFMDQKIGYAEIAIAESRFGDRKAITVSFELAAKVEMLGVPQEMTITETRTYVLGEGLVSFLSETKSAGSVMKLAGELRDGTMHIKSIVGGHEKTSITERPREKFEDYIAEERLVREGAAIGDEISFTQYQPTLQKSITAICRLKEIQEKRIQGVQTKVYVIETTLEELGVVSMTLVDSNGEVLQAQVAGVYTMRREDERLAKNVEYRSDLILSTVIRPEKKIKNASAVKEMKVKLSGVKDRALLVPSERQQFRTLPGGDEILTVKVEDLSGVKIPEIPMKKDEFKKELSPSLFIQSDNPVVVRRAREIVGEERDALKASNMIVNWVFKNLKKRFSASFSNALDVLATGEGDCTEHAVLYVACARAAGLPAREVSGIVYSEEDAGFYYHQWAEAFVGKWIAVDPTFGQTQADATHIAFARGDLLLQARLLKLIGSLGVEVIDCGYDGKK